jgi:UDP-N-acetylmuramoylalanine--D-glutamate ligase
MNTTLHERGFSMTHALYKDKKVGIWGFGKTGQSVLAFVAPHAEKVTIFESAPLSETQLTLLKKYNALLVPDGFLDQFLELNDIIVPSPGVDLRPYEQGSDPTSLSSSFEGHRSTLGPRFVSELDIFAANVTTKTIAITGSVGKTSTVTLLTELLNRCGIPAIAGGNIGTPMLDLIKDQQQYQYLVLELSSFQLERSSSFAPSIAAITNLFPNHLDRHGDLANYAQAKGRLLVHQQETDWAIIPFEFLEAFIPYTSHQKVWWLAHDAYLDTISSQLTNITFTQNWQLIFAILEQCGIQPETALPYCLSLTIPEHRFERVGTHQGIIFYNDSKATIAESMLESVNRLKHQPILLFLGGVDKGVDRSPAIAQLPKNVTHVFCFGKEAEIIHQLCEKNGIHSSAHPTLETAWELCKKIAQPGDAVLFSPAGASYDLFKNYEERGNIFKQLVQEFCTP